jgi:hypothetical protein
MRSFTFRDRLTGSAPLDQIQGLLVGRVVSVTVEAGTMGAGIDPGQYRVTAIEAAPDQLLSGGLVAGQDVLITLEEVPEPEEYRLRVTEEPTRG